MKQTTIFRQLIYNIVFPVVLALIILGVINFRNTRNNLKEASRAQNFLISDQIIRVLQFQDITLSVVEENLNTKLEQISNELVNSYFASTKKITKADLSKIRAEMKLDPKLYDFYVIDTNGIVVNTTFTKDMGLNFFGFGEEHEMMIRKIFRDKRFVSEKFTVENHTRRLKKYTYQTTNDGLYIIELGVYSSTADEIIDVIKSTLEEFSVKQSTIVASELFMNADNPFSLSKTDVIDPKEKEILIERFEKKDTLLVEFKEDKRYLSKQYFYMEMSDSELYKGSVVRIVTDRTDEINDMYFKLLSYIMLFLLIMIVIIVLIYQKTRTITNPIKNLLSHVNRISNGNLSERAEVVGNNEITTLSRKFNVMIEQLEEFYNELDQKVKERTAEVVAQKEEIQSQRDAIERQMVQLTEQQKHIMDSIHYAKRLQNAILPTTELVNSLFEESFILYMPKDIVSGDFYWFYELNGKKFFSAIDCTGHGVPGALVSMVGHNWLDYAVKDLKKDKPGEILTALDEGVCKTFKESGTATSVKDGMDLALCCVDYNAMKLEFAGAYNPVIIVRNGELIQIKGDKFPIGGAFANKDKTFTNHEIDIQKGDMVYVFSDGYPDQFGGPNGRKFLIKNFRDLLVEISGKELKEQHIHLENTLFEWMATENQIDDIIVIGIKI